MKQKKTIVVIGGVAAGASAAAKARREDEEADIIIYEKGPYVSFANCGLPYYVGNVIKRKEALLLHTPQSLYERFRLQAYVHHEVVAIQPKEHRVIVNNLDRDVTFQQPYDKLIIATGATPIIPPIEGITSPFVKLLRTVPEAEEWKKMIEAGRVRHAVVVGGGFIGLEAVDNLCRQGVAVSLVEKADQVMPPLDKEMVIDLQEELRRMGVSLYLQNGVKRFFTQDGNAMVQLEDDTVLKTDLVLLSIGVRPDVTLAQQAGLQLGPTGALAVNERMETSEPDIYAAGDVVETRHGVTGKAVWLPLAGPANKQGRVAGANAAGKKMTFPGVFGTSIVRVGHVVAGKTGLSEKDCLREGIPYRITYNYAEDHAGYYPGAELMLIKLLSQKDSGRILGAQISGGKGVDKRIDVIAMALYSQLTVEDLENIDLAYAPPFGAAKDPVIMAGMTHANLYRGEVRAFTPQELERRLEQGTVQLVDVREEAECRQSSMIPGAVLIPLSQLRERMQELDRSKETVFYCRSGHRSYFATRMAAQSGFGDVKNLLGGFLAWEQMKKARKR